MKENPTENNRIDGNRAARETQIRALFNRQKLTSSHRLARTGEILSFAVTLPSSSVNARLYVGVAAQGRSPKVAMLRVYLALLGSGQRWHNGLKRRAKSRTLPIHT